MKNNINGNRARFRDGELENLLSAINSTYDDSFGINLQDDRNLPRRNEVIALLGLVEEIILPGFDLLPRHRDSFESVTANLLVEIRYKLYDQIYRAFRYACDETDCDTCCVTDRSLNAVKNLMNALPTIREKIKDDVKNAYNGDPAARSIEEIIFAYPGVKAVMIQRIAHELYLTNTPLIPRLMTEYAHTMTGIDIHPGAQLGRGVFIDHGTGVVIGETCEIGNNVQIYQGVTLGALSFPKDACGVLIKGKKRHPTVEENVTIYSGATVLGDIIIGKGSVIGGNVWITESLSPGTKVTVRAADQNVRTKNNIK